MTVPDDTVPASAPDPAGCVLGIALVLPVWVALAAAFLSTWDAAAAVLLFVGVPWWGVTLYAGARLRRGRDRS